MDRHSPFLRNILLAMKAGIRCLVLAMANVNASLFKDFGIWERLKFQFRAEVRNVFNHPSAIQPELRHARWLVRDDPTTWGDFGTITSPIHSARAIQLAGKIVF